MKLYQVTVPITDLTPAIAFYQRLGFDLIALNKPGYARFICPDGETPFSLEVVTREAAGTGVTVYFECDDLDERVAELKKRGIDFESDPEDMPWERREARLRDPDGNRLCLFLANGDSQDPPWHGEAAAEG